MNEVGSNLLIALIPVLVPVLIAGLKVFIPKIPKVLLPVLAPILGVLIDFGSSYATGAGVNPLVGALLGSAGIGMREILDQLNKSTHPAASTGAPGGRINLP